MFYILSANYTSERALHSNYREGILRNMLQRYNFSHFIQEVRKKNKINRIEIITQINLFGSITIFIFQNIAILGPTWEFPPCLKSCNLASWTTKWHDYARGTSRPPTHPPAPALVENPTVMQYRRLEFGGCGGCLIGVCKVQRGCLEGTKKGV